MLLGFLFLSLLWVFDYKLALLNISKCSTKTVTSLITFSNTDCPAGGTDTNRPPNHPKTDWLTDDWPPRLEAAQQGGISQFMSVWADRRWPKIVDFSVAHKCEKYRFCDYFEVILTINRYYSAWGQNSPSARLLFVCNFLRTKERLELSSGSSGKKPAHTRQADCCLLPLLSSLLNSEFCNQRVHNLLHKTIMERRCRVALWFLPVLFIASDAWWLCP